MCRRPAALLFDEWCVPGIITANRSFGVMHDTLRFPTFDDAD